MCERSTSVEEFLKKKYIDKKYHIYVKLRVKYIAIKRMNTKAFVVSVENESRLLKGAKCWLDRLRSI